MDRVEKRVLCVFHSADDLALFDRAKPFHLALGVWHLDVGAPMVHAAVVGRNGRGLLLPGKGGSGKSTTALACALAGFDYLGDDTVGLKRTSETAVRAHAIYGSATVATDNIHRFPALASHTIAGTRPDDDKPVVMLTRLLERQPLHTVSLAAVVLPQVVGAGETRVRPASRGEALRALAPTTVLFFPGGGAGHLQFLGDVVSRLPCFRLEIGADVGGIPVAAGRLLEELS